MVQEYTQADNSCFGFGGSPTGIRNTGNSFPNPRTKSGSGYLASHTELLILVDIRMSNGVHIS